MTEDEAMLKHKNIVQFKQMGFVPYNVSGNQVVGLCPFCGKKKFHINPETKKWDCKTCHESGGEQSYIEPLVELYKENFKARPALVLAKKKNLSMRILKQHNIGYIPHKDAYVLPVLKSDGSGVWTVQIFRGGKLLGLSQHPVGLLGWEKLEKAKYVWICEGAWDKMALEIMLEENGFQKEHCVVAAPGASTFKQEWASLFEDKEVFVAYDHDEPGKLGAGKVYNVLKNITKKMLFLHWPEDKKSGYDLRDYKLETDEKKVARVEWLKKLMQAKPPKPEKVMKKASVIKPGEGGDEQVDDDVLDEYDGEFINPKDIVAGYRKYLHLPHADVLDVMFGTIIANRLEGDPLWVFLVAPPGGTKTELLNSISSGPNIVTTSSLTPRALVSGSTTSGGGDPSLIPRLNNKCLVVKDFTVVLNMPQLQRDEIFGILRDAYDGRTEKDFGNGVRRKFKVKFGFISGVTPAYEQYTQGNSSLGERFLLYKIPIPVSARERQKYLMRAEENTGKEVEMRESLAALGSAVLKYNYTKVPEVPKSIKQRTLSLAQYLAQMRGTVTRDKFTREITHNAYAELGTRLVKQFTKLMFGISMFRGESKVSDSVYNIVKDMAVSTAPARMERLVEHMYRSDCEAWYETGELAEVLQLPKAPVERLVEDLKALRMLERQKLGMGKSSWKLSDDALFLIEEAEVYL